MVLLTSSKGDVDMAESYLFGVNSYISKPVKFDNFAKTVAGLGLYGLLADHLPVTAQ